MPKRRPRLTQRKGTSAAGRSTRQKTTPSNLSCHSSVSDTQEEPATSAGTSATPPPSKRIKVLENILVVPAPEPTLDEAHHYQTHGNHNASVLEPQNDANIDVRMTNSNTAPSTPSPQLKRKYTKRWPSTDSTQLSGCSTRTTRNKTRTNTHDPIATVTPQHGTAQLITSAKVTKPTQPPKVLKGIVIADEFQPPAPSGYDSSIDVTATADVATATPSTPTIKGKQRVSFYSIPAAAKTPIYDKPQFVPANHIQEALLMLTSHGLPSIHTLENLGMAEDTKNLIISMLRFFPTHPLDLQQQGSSKEDTSTMQPVRSTDTVLNSWQSRSDLRDPLAVQVGISDHSNAPPALDHPAEGDLIVEAPRQPTPIEDVEQALFDAVYEIQREDQARIRAAIQQDWLEIAHFQHQVNQVRDPNNTYLMAMDRHLRRGASYLGELRNTCSFCSALYFRRELNSRNVYTKCCRQGKVRLPAFRQMPHLLATLFGGQHPQSRNFKQHILSFNYAFQFVSLEANLRQMPAGRAPTVYAVQGKIYHHLSNININQPVQRYGPIYFLDPQEAIQHRNNNNDGLNRDTIESIENLLRQINPYAQAYMHLRNRYNLELETIERLRAEAVRLGRAFPLQMPTVTLELLTVRGANNRQYDVPAVNEVAAVYNANPDHPPNPNLKVYVLDNPTAFRTVNNESEILDPMVFPLMFPFGEQGWHIHMPHHGVNSRITLCEYYAYRLAIRDNDKRFQFAGRLTQQYIVASYIKVEANNLKFFRLNQDKLRAENYAGLADYLHRRVDADEEAVAVGRMVILPSTFIGSPRYQQQLFQDSMAVVARFGTPSLFITMTTNPKWREIVENIPQGTQANDHAMLLARVFQTKVDELMNDILDANAFGVPIANLYVIEFQKRGLPHVHILTILRNEDRLVDPERVDLLISAEIPDPHDEPELYDIVAKNLIHGPCGVLNPHSVCMVDGRCSKKFPKPFVAQTTINDDGKMTYRRRDDGRTVNVSVNGQQVALDNTWIVPYNAYTLLKYNCHINVEACATVGCVKYLYKYFFKGVDQALLKINVEHELVYDEVESYLNARCLSPPEACWHINQFPLHKNTHSVIRLPIHLDHQQNVNFQPGAEIDALRRNETTQLTGWFALNARDVQARQYLYIEIPLHYVWDKPNKCWKRRQQRGNLIVSRMYSVSIRAQELYYLRLLLLHVRGPQNYEDVRTVDGVVCDTFQEACQLRNLLTDDIEWRRALQEAADRQMPHQLRSMFAYMLIFCEISDKQTLLATFLDSFIEDHIRRDVDRLEAIRLALTAIQHILIVHGTRLSDFGLPEPLNMEVPQQDAIDVDNERLIGDTMRTQLNARQSEIFESVMDSVHNEDFAAQRLFFINAPAGSGKSFLFQTLISVLRGQQISVIALAPTGLAASILKGGRTLHSRFKIPLDVNETTTSGVRPLSQDGRRIAAAKLIIIDEISMVTKTIFNLVERALRDICNHNGPFANKTVLLAGDFRQTLPIVPHGNRCSIVDATIKGSCNFPTFEHRELDINVRAQEGEEQNDFSRWLLQLGDGTLPPFRRTFYGNIIRLPPQCIVDNKQNLIDFCFDNLRADAVPNAVILTPLNTTCQDVNELILDKLPGPIRTYYSADAVDVTDDPSAEMANYTVEFLNTLAPSGVPPHKLTLKVGCVVMVLRNLNFKKGLCNGTRLLIRVLGNRYIDAEIIDMTGRLTGERVFIPRMDLSPATAALPFKLKRRQFPIKLSYALTINKSQGQTFDKVGIYLPQPVFAHGQLYVAFSRARNFQGVRAFLEDTPVQGKINAADPQAVYTRNIVYREIL